MADEPEQQPLPPVQVHAADPESKITLPSLNWPLVLLVGGGLAAAYYLYQAGKVAAKATPAFRAMRMARAMKK